MAQHPLLIFPQPTRAEKARRFGFGRPPRIPDGRRQAERLTPLFLRLQQAMDHQRMALQSNSLGLQPEQALVLETIGPIDRFVNAIKKVPGLEWLGEFETDEIVPEYGFQDEEDPERKLKSHVFLVMTDQRALQDLQRLFNNWKQDRDAPFPRGLAPLKHAFAHLHTIRPWDAEDRIRDTGILEDWQYRVEHGQEVVPFEVELWFREKPDRRRQAEAYLGSVIQSLGGQIVQQSVIPQIAYHGILGKIQIREFSDLLSEMSRLRNFRLLNCEDIMHLRPVGQCALPVQEDLRGALTIDEGRRDLPHGEPVVALFDGLPLTGHRLLDMRLNVDDPDEFERAYQARERIHGTAMASLICHGDLNGREGLGPSKKPLYVRPILKPYKDFNGQSIEAIPEEVLPIDLLHRAVRRMYENEGSESPMAPTVRVINLSVCDRSRPFDREMSAWGRLVDWLSWKYKVLFVVSAGNHSREIVLNLPRTELAGLSAENRQKAVIMAIADETRHRRLLSPAETLNGLTVGAIHEDASPPVTNPSLIDPFIRPGLPCTFSAHGPGYRRTIKPDILLPGGKQFLFEKLGTAHPNATLRTVDSYNPPGQLVAAPGTAGELDQTVYMRGTSNAAAQASRWAIFISEVIEELRAQPGVSLPSEYDTVLLKALLVHGADWVSAGPVYDSILRDSQDGPFREYIGRFIGYGSANVAKVMNCTDQRVTILGVGELDDGEAHEFVLPLPPSLSAVTEKRRLTVTLAWLSPVNSLRQSYRVAQLWFDPKNRIAPDRICADGHAVQRGTVQHEVLEGERAVDFQDGDTIVIKVNCRADAGDIPEPIQYGLAVTLEVAEGIGIRIYQEVRDRLRVRVPVRGGNP